MKSGLSNQLKHNSDWYKDGHITQAGPMRMFSSTSAGTFGGKGAVFHQETQEKGKSNLEIEETDRHRDRVIERGREGERNSFFFFKFFLMDHFLILY